MSIVVLGLNQRTVPLAVLERAAIGADALPKALHDLRSRPNVSEAVVLATCNRTEVVVVAERFHGAYADVRDFFADLTGLAPDEITLHLAGAHDDAAVAHLFRVAAGLDSAVVGEHEILGQLRSAWDVAREEGAARAALNLLFRHAIEVGKRVRTDTAIGRGTASVSHAAVELATERLGELAGRTVLVLGAGEMGEQMTVALGAAGAGDVVIANRTVARAADVAARVGGRAVTLAALEHELATADVVLASTGAGGVVLDDATVRAALADRPTRPLLIVDIAVPRNVDHAVGAIDGVTLLDLDDLRAWAAKGMARRAGEVAAAEAIVAGEVDRYLDVAQAREVAPLVALLHERGENVRQAELARARRKLGALDDEQWATVEALTRSMVAKLLHQPSVRLKTDAGSARAERNAAALRDLFDLDDPD